MIIKSIHNFYFILAPTQIVKNKHISPFIGAAGEGAKKVFWCDSNN
jgi:hypothetical protein